MKLRIRMMIVDFLNKYGFYTKDQLEIYKKMQIVTSGHCGCCGKPIKGIFLREYAWGICKECLDVDWEDKK